MLLAGTSAHARIAHGYSNFFSINAVSAVDESSSLPQDTAITKIYPNPFNPVTSIEFELSEPGEIELSVFDLRGRLVKVLDRSSRACGRFRITWDGRGNEGVLLPTGKYFCRLVTSRGAQTHALTLVK